MPTANTSVGISGILKLPRRTICLIESVKALLGIKINGCGMTWLPGAKIISFLICCSTSEGAKWKHARQKKRRRNVSKETCLRLSVVTQLHRYRGLGFLIDTAGSEILIRFKFHVPVKVAEFFSARASTACLQTGNKPLRNDTIVTLFFPHPHWKVQLANTSLKINRLWCHKRIRSSPRLVTAPSARCLIISLVLWKNQQNISSIQKKQTEFYCVL